MWKNRSAITHVILRAGSWLLVVAAILLGIAGAAIAILAGVIYWALLGVLGLMLTPRIWAIAVFIGSGLIFPLGLLWQNHWAPKYPCAMTR